MIIGVLSDTHGDRVNALPYILREFKQRKVELVVHCGDIEAKHLNSFGDFKVICALVDDEQVKHKDFKTPPKDWVFTAPKDRVRSFGGVKMYVGHKRSFDFWNGSESALAKTLEFGETPALCCRDNGRTKRQSGGRV